jgi:uncharacterized membrane protein YfcA
MFLEVATVAGGLLGGITAQLVSEHLLERLFAVTMVVVGTVMAARANRRNVLCDPRADPGPFGCRYYEAESRGMVTYQVRRMPLAIGASFVAGNLSSLLGIGGGVVKVPVLNAWCGVPMRAAAATSALMIGVTATGGAIIYFGHGDLDLLLAAPAILGVQLGSRLGMRFTERASARWLKLLMAAVLYGVAMLMVARSLR